MASSNLAKGQPSVPDAANFLDFAPDADPIQPGLLLDCDNVYPVVKGYRSYPGLVRFSTNALNSQCLGAFTGRQGLGDILVAGTENKIYELVNKTFVDSGMAPSLITHPARWRFDLYGNDLIAVNGVDRPFLRMVGGVWGPLGGTPPIASIVQATEFALFLIEPNSNIWHSSLSDSIWTNSIATQTVSGQLYATSGNITAAHSLRSGIALFKRNGLHYATWQGPPLYWSFPPISHEVGAPSQEAVANIGDVLLWPGPDDFYQFDGQSLSRIPNTLKEWFFTELNQSEDYEIRARWDQQKSLVFWHFPSASSSGDTLDRWICYNLRTGKWSKSNQSIECPVFAAVETGTLTYASFTDTYGTYGGITPGLTYGDLRSRNNDISGAFNLDHALYLYNGAPGSSYITTHDWGDRHNMYQVTRVRPFFSIRPEQGATVYVYNQYNPGSTPVLKLSKSMSDDDWFNFVNTARLQRFKIVFNSEMEITGTQAMVEYAGER